MATDPAELPSDQGDGLEDDRALRRLGVGLLLRCWRDALGEGTATKEATAGLHWDQTLQEDAVAFWADFWADRVWSAVGLDPALLTQARRLLAVTGHLEGEGQK